MAVTAGGAVIELILARRSVREGFATTPVPKRDLELITKCGLAAPSSKNARPWHFHVVQDRYTLNSIAEAVRTADGAANYVPHDPRTGAPYPHYVSSVAESADVLQAAPAAVFIENRGVFSGGRAQLAQATKDALRGSITGYGLELIGLGAAIENMWLAANALGLLAAFIGDVVVAEVSIQRQLRVTGDLVGALVLGYVQVESASARQPSSQELVTWH